MNAQTQEALNVIAARFDEFAKYRDDAVAMLKSADERMQALSVVRVCMPGVATPLQLACSAFRSMDIAIPPC